MYDTGLFLCTLVYNSTVEYSDFNGRAMGGDDAKLVSMLTSETTSVSEVLIDHQRKYSSMAERMPVKHLTNVRFILFPQNRVLYFDDFVVSDKGTRIIH